MDNASERIDIEKDVIRRRVLTYAESSGVALNPDPAVVDTILDRMARRKVREGEFYCPERELSGDREFDRKLICPCDFHLKEIAEEGHCKCGLFVKAPEGPPGQ